MGQAGVGVANCAAADMAFGVGICPTLDLEAAGSPIGLGVDGSASNDSSNMMEAVRHSLLLARLQIRPFGGVAASTRCAGRPRARPRASGATTSAASRRNAGRSRPLQARRSPFYRRPGPDSRAAAVRRPSRRPGDDRRPLARHRRPAGRRRPRGLMSEHAGDGEAVRVNGVAGFARAFGSGQETRRRLKAPRRRRR